MFLVSTLVTVAAGIGAPLLILKVMSVLGSNTPYLYSWLSFSGKLGYVWVMSISHDRLSSSVFLIPLMEFELNVAVTEFNTPILSFFI